VRNELSRTSLISLCFASALLAAACETLSPEPEIAIAAASVEAAPNCSNEAARGALKQNPCPKH